MIGREYRALLSVGAENARKDGQTLLQVPGSVAGPLGSSEMALIREFFELLAVWEETNREN